MRHYLCLEIVPVLRGHFRYYCLRTVVLREQGIIIIINLRFIGNKVRTQYGKEKIKRKNKKKEKRKETHPYKRQNGGKN